MKHLPTFGSTFVHKLTTFYSACSGFALIKVENKKNFKKALHFLLMVAVFFNNIIFPLTLLLLIFNFLSSENKPAGLGCSINFYRMYLLDHCTSGGSTSQPLNNRGQ